MKWYNHIKILYIIIKLINKIKEIYLIFPFVAIGISSIAGYSVVGIILIGARQYYSQLASLMQSTQPKYLCFIVKWNKLN